MMMVRRRRRSNNVSIINSSEIVLKLNDHIVERMRQKIGQNILSFYDYFHTTIK